MNVSLDMKRSKKPAAKLMKRVLCGMVSIFMLCLSMASCFVEVDAAESKETVTVAYIDYNNFITKNKDGSYTGYAVDYLDKIAEYAGWDYKFVDMDRPEAYEAVKSGNIDFYCVARQTNDRQDEFDFSLYPVCNEEMNMYTMPDSKIYYEDYKTFDGLKIGMLKDSVEINFFKQYAAKNDFDYDLVEYSMNEEAVKALNAGEVDAIALVNYSVKDHLKLVGNFGVAPAYMMSTENSKYMKRFSKAQEQLFFDDPAILQKLEEQYYGKSKKSLNLMLNRAEAEYISKAEPMTVALSENMAPMEYYDESTGEFRGVVVDLYKKISELTGLKFKFVKRGDAPILISQMKKGEVQLIGALAQSKDVEKALKIKQTKAFAENSFTLVAADIDSLIKESVAAVPAGYPRFNAEAKQDGYTDIKEYATFDECISAVAGGEADLTYIISMCEGYLLDHVKYSDLHTMTLSDEGYSVCLGVSEASDTEILQSLLNKSISAISKSDIDEIIVSNTARAKPEQTAQDFFSKNGVIFLFAGILICVLLAFIVIRRQRLKQKKILNRNLQQHNDFLQHLYNTLPCGIFRYSYEAPHKILSYNAACARIYGYDGEFPVLGKAPDSVVKGGTAEAFQAKFDLCERTDGVIIYTWPIIKKDGTEAFTECVMDVVETDDGKEFQEVFIDITERMLQEKQIEKRYSQELKKSGNKEEGLLYMAWFDITEQILVETDIDVPGIHAGMTVPEFVEGLRFELEDLQTEAEMEDFSTRFTLGRMEKAYENEEYDQSFDLCRHKNGQIQWLRSDLVLRSNPATGHLMCFDYIWDVTNDRVTNEVMRRLAFADCEGFMSIFMSSGRCLQYDVVDSNEFARTESRYGESDMITLMSKNMKEDDAVKFLKDVDMSVISEQLQDAPHYQVYATLWDENDVRSDKALIYFYTNEENGVLAVTVTDVTEVRASEVRHAQLLADALEAAEKADAAKSQFLSRVSHEMRTPLNAIIGFIELAKDADAEKVSNYLASSDIAAKQLLNVINDVLDMSSIESGKMKISNASFNFKHLISSVTNIYGTQCKQKGILFETKITTPIEDWLVGDELRVNQILMNLLGNAVKFTSEGNICLSVSKTTDRDDRVFIRFEISDTGCGMSDQMKARLFKPFEQESTTTARKYGGSGLGLSIVKNLVGMMDGSVRVESKQGEGSVFTVDLPFAKSDIEEDILTAQEIETLRVLAVDDRESELEYVSLILRRIGVRFTCVRSGREAIDELQRAEESEDMYNVCLVDWRMPEMNGIDTTKKIREKYGRDVVVIVVSAYDFQQAGESAKEAGANLFLSKPIFQSSLFDLFMTLTAGRVATPKKAVQEWDFAGRRVLLAEDNAFNQVVAREYLTRFHLAVDIAENGQIAVDMFNNSAPGYYDAILMDIQMPVMDGFEATKAIRESNHPDAKTIEIIAQTADAFNEDISKALEAGMNAHLAKPIEPDVLAKTLCNGFAEKDKK